VGGGGDIENGNRAIPEHLINLFPGGPPPLMPELGGPLPPLARNPPASFSLTKGLPVPNLMGITSPHICSSFSLRCRAYAEEVCSNVETIGVQKVEVAEQGGLENGKREIPEHLINLFDKSKGELDDQSHAGLY
jgi:hypothetical protein